MIDKVSHKEISSSKNRSFSMNQLAIKIDFCDRIETRKDPLIRMKNYNINKTSINNSLNENMNSLSLNINFTSNNNLSQNDLMKNQNNYKSNEEMKDSKSKNFYGMYINSLSENNFLNFEFSKRNFCPRINNFNKEIKSSIYLNFNYYSINYLPSTIIPRENLITKKFYTESELKKSHECLKASKISERNLLINSIYPSQSNSEKSSPSDRNSSLKFSKNNLSIGNIL